MFTACLKALYRMICESARKAREAFLSGEDCFHIRFLNGCKSIVNSLNRRSQMFKPKRIPMVAMVAIIFLISIAFWDSYVRAGTLEFDGVPVDLTTSTSEDLVIVPGVGGNTHTGNYN